MTRNALKGRLIFFLVLIIPLLTLYTMFDDDTDKETVEYGKDCRLGRT